MGVAARYGRTTPTCTPLPRTSRRTADVKPMTPAFAPEYTASPAMGLRPVALATWTTDPRPRASIRGSTSRVACTTAR
ncbi:hypothetical protein CBZ_32750 [Cellulomonas biazotea]|uniref:Uncharacterized protein n=1 Tax=Cellulomonas biazotea TaxID=1709 RepID=A0A402DVP7_9CELL|nr:hypothetical protein CBZ_32750 [Cellulomonas biazotea]